MRLQFTIAGDSLLCTVAGETLSQKHTLLWDDSRREQAARLGRELVGVLTRGNRAHKLTDENLAELRRIGEELLRALVPAPVQEELRRGSGPLLLEIDEALVAVPWELCHDGERFLCRRYDLGRSVQTSQALRAPPARSVGTPARILILCSDPDGDLSGVREEGEAIAAELDRHPSVRARVSSAPTLAFVRRHLKDYDVVHFAGHADFQPDDPGAGGWHLGDGTLAAGEVAALGGGRPMPILVFSNACQSGRTAPWSDAPGRGSTARVYGLPNAFLVAGVRHYLGTQWEIVDGQSATFAAAFHAGLAGGASIGAVVRRAREAVIARGGEGDLAWASYVLYGDPEFAPLRRDEPRSAELPSARQLDARASAPWKRPRARESSSLALRGARAAGRFARGEGRALSTGRLWLAAAIGVGIGLAVALLAAALLLRR